MTDEDGIASVEFSPFWNWVAKKIGMLV